MSTRLRCGRTANRRTETSDSESSRGKREFNPPQLRTAAPVRTVVFDSESEVHSPEAEVQSLEVTRVEGKSETSHDVHDAKETDHQR